MALFDGSIRMAGNQNTLLRHWHMLRMLPRGPRKVTVQDIRHALERQGFEVTERTIQRDLVELNDVFPLDCDDREKPFGWCWRKDAPNFDLPALSVSDALTLAMVEKHLTNLMPAPMLEQMAPYFDAARKLLDAEPKPHRGRSWLDKVRVVPPMQPLLPPKVDSEVQRTISEALLHERQVQIQYRRRGDKSPVEYRIHPLALIQRGPVLYLYVRIFDYEDGRTLALHRITSAQLLDEPAAIAKDFSIDAQVESGTWGFGQGEMIQVELVFQSGYGDHLYETPLSKDQAIEALPDERLKVTATIADTPQLLWWLMGFGEGVKIVSPAKLLDAMAATAEEMVRVYHKESDH